GAIFKVSPSGKLAVVYSFTGGFDGQFPTSGLTLGADGNFYGTTEGGGQFGWGTVFKLTPAGVFATLHSFANSTDGGQPYAPPVQGADGNFYGTTYQGGTGDGAVYKITPGGTLTPLYQFDGTHGLYPYAPLVLGADNNLYGTTEYGGAHGRGVIFRIT